MKKQEDPQPPPKCVACGGPRNPRAQVDICVACEKAIAEGVRYFADAAKDIFWTTIRDVRQRTALRDPDGVRNTGISAQKLTLLAVARGLPQLRDTLIDVIKKSLDGEAAAQGKISAPTLYGPDGQVILSRLIEDAEAETMN